MKLQPTIEQLVPYLILGVAIALAIGLFIILTHVLVWGVIIGGILWICLVIKNYFFPRANPDQKEGRVIEHNDDND